MSSWPGLESVCWRGMKDGDTVLVAVSFILL